MTNLTKTQRIILIAAAKRTDGDIEPMPDNINAGIKPRVLNALLSRKLIIKTDFGYAISTEGYQTIGATPASKSKPKLEPSDTKISLREGTKQARLIALMKRPEGASIDELCEETGWLKHTVRGVFSNTLKKRLGLTVTSYKDANQPRRYRIVEPMIENAQTDELDTTEQEPL
jgi:hypothetical protein